MATAVPSLQSLEALSSYFQLSQKKVQKIVQFLSEHGLVQSSADGKLKAVLGQMHLPSDSTKITQHHTNWRLKAIDSLENLPTDRHYSSAVSMSRKDSPAIRSILIDAIQQIRGLVRNSNEEAVFAYTLDFFEVGQGEPSES